MVVLRQLAPAGQCVVLCGGELWLGSVLPPIVPVLLLAPAAGSMP